MIRSIEIENFRCFHKTRIEGFSQINLIGGQNNAGKTALLEAILLVNNPNPDSILFLQQKLRGEYGNPEVPERTWSSLFFSFDKQQKANILAVAQTQTSYGIKLACQDSIRTPTITPTVSNQDIVKIEDNSTMKDIIESSLIIDQSTQKQIGSSIQIRAIKGEETLFHSATFLPVIHSTFFIPAGFKQTADRLASSYQNLLFKGNEDTVLEALQLIDEKIEKIDIIEKKLHLKRTGEIPMPVGMFGDALNKVIDIIIRIANHPHCILLIDEVENGIHYTHQFELWQKLFQLAKTFDVQIFAVSHSLEMIKAFNAASLEDEFGQNVSYFEMFRSLRSNEIVANSLSKDTLSYAIANNQSFRGE